MKMTDAIALSTDVNECLRISQSRFSPFSTSTVFFCFRCKVKIHVSSLVINRRKNSAKGSIEISPRRCFCSIVSKPGTHLVHNCFMSNVRCTALYVMPTRSSNSSTFSRRSSSNTILQIFFAIAGMLTPFWYVRFSARFKSCHQIILLM